MKANELMIGDWVSIPHINKIGKVYRVDQANGKGNGYAAVIDGDFNESLLRAIPLTAEMLENNDIYDIYEKDDIPLFRTYKLKTRYGFRFQNCHPCTISISANILYVHELQHLLRLCGFTELANSFRVN